MNVKKFVSNSFLLNFPYIIGFLLRFITLPIILKAIPVENYGKLQFAFALQEWSIAFTANNITTGMKRGLAKGLNGTLIFAFLKRFLFLVITAVLLMLVSLGMYVFLNKVLLAKLLTIITIFMISGYIFQVTLFEFFVAKKKFLQWTIWQIIISSVSIIGSAIVAYFTRNIIWFIIFQLGSITLLSFVGLIYIIKKYNILISYKKGEIDKECFSYGVKLISADLVSLTAYKISHFIIGPFFGFSNLAVFSIAERLRSRFSEIIRTIRVLFYSDFAKLDKEKLSYKIERKLIILVSASLIISFLLMLIGSGYIKYFLPDTYHKAIIYFFILSFSFPASILSIIFQTMLESHLRYREFAIVKIVSDIIKTFLILTLGYLWKVVGVCLGITIGMWINLVFYYFFALKKSFSVRNICKYGRF